MQPVGVDDPSKIGGVGGQIVPAEEVADGQVDETAKGFDKDKLICYIILKRTRR